MKKRTGTILTVLLCLLMILVIPACDNKTPEPEPEKQEEAGTGSGTESGTGTDTDQKEEGGSSEITNDYEPTVVPLDAEHPYSTKYWGIFDDQVATYKDLVDKKTTASAHYSIYIPKDAQTRSPVMIVLLPDGVKANEFATSEEGLKYLALAKGSDDPSKHDYDKFAVAFVEGDNYKWNNGFDAEGRNDALAVYAVFKQINSTSVDASRSCYYSLDKNRVYLVGIKEGAEAALYAAAKYPAAYSNLTLIDLPHVDEAKLKEILDESAWPYLTSKEFGYGEIKNSEVQMPIFTMAADDTESEKVRTIYDDYAALHAKVDTTEMPELIVREKIEAGTEISAIWNEHISKNGRYLGYPGGTIREAIPVYAEGFKFYEDDSWTFMTPKTENRKVVVDENGNPVMEERNHVNRFVTYKGKNVKPGSKYPLVLALHGQSAGLGDLIGECRWNDIADEEDLIICYVQGTMDPDSTFPAPGWPADNVIKQLEHDIAKMKELFPDMIDETRIYAAGHSLGAMTLGGTVMIKAPTLAAAYSMNGGFSGGSEEAGKFLTPCIGQMAQYDFFGGKKAPEASESMGSINKFLTLNGMAADMDGVAHEETLGNNKYFTTDFNIGEAPVVRYTGVAQSPHVYMAEEARMSWEFFKDWSRDTDGTSLYKGVAVAMPAPAEE